MLLHERFRQKAVLNVEDEVAFVHASWRDLQMRQVDGQRALLATVEIEDDSLRDRRSDVDEGTQISKVHLCRAASFVDTLERMRRRVMRQVHPDKAPLSGVPQKQVIVEK